MNRWQILCAGPSLKDAKPERGIPTVGLNIAIRHASRPDYYCCPEGSHRKFPPLHRPKEGWVKRRTEPVLWEKSIKLSGINGRIPWAPKTRWPQSSIFYAIAICAGRGAKEIVIMGSDMEGNCYWDPHTQEEVALGKSRSYDTKRWPAERAALDGVIAECDEHGVKVFRA